MPCFEIDGDSLVTRRWLDVHSLSDLFDKYGLSGAGFILGDAIPGQSWVDGAGVDPTAPAPVVDLARNLTRAEFNGMLAAKGLDTIWTSMQAALTGAAGSEAEEFRFLLAANLHTKFYNLSATLLLVGEFRDLAATINADYAEMLTDDNITAAWRATAARRDGVKS